MWHITEYWLCSVYDVVVRRGTHHYRNSRASFRFLFWASYATRHRWVRILDSTSRVRCEIVLKVIPMAPTKQGKARLFPDGNGRMVPLKDLLKQKIGVKVFTVLSVQRVPFALSCCGCAGDPDPFLHHHTAAWREKCDAKVIPHDRHRRLRHFERPSP